MDIQREKFYPIGGGVGWGCGVDGGVEKLMRFALTGKSLDGSGGDG